MPYSAVCELFGEVPTARPLSDDVFVRGFNSDGRMDKFQWKPTRDDLVNILYALYADDGASM